LFVCLFFPSGFPSLFSILDKMSVRAVGIERGTSVAWGALQEVQLGCCVSQGAGGWVSAGGILAAGRGHGEGGSVVDF
jgi:hypothetical protein